MKILLLDMIGIIVVLLAAGIVAAFSGPYVIPNLLVALTFLIVGIVITKYKYEEKKEKGVYEHERSWQNVVSNSAFPLFCCIAYSYTGSIAWIAAYLGGFAGAMADKFGSEIGVLSERPISLGSFKRVKQGTSGAVSPLGTYLSLIGALIIGVVGYFLYHYSPLSIFSVAIFGLIGSVADSFAGVLEERGIGTKGTSNLICTIAGGALAFYLLVL